MADEVPQLEPDPRELRSTKFKVRDAEERIDAEAVRLAHQLRHSARRRIGLVPASPDVIVWPLALELGIALEKVSGRPVALVDLELDWPPLEPSVASTATGAPDLFCTGQVLCSQVALMTPHIPAPPGARVQLLELMLAFVDNAMPEFHHVVLDLTPFQERQGEFIAATEAVQGVLVVGRAAKTKEDMLLRLTDALPEGLNLGVVLLD